MEHDTSRPLFLMVAHIAPHSANAGAVLQAPPDVVRKMRHIESPERRIYAGTLNLSITLLYLVKTYLIFHCHINIYGLQNN